MSALVLEPLTRSHAAPLYAALRAEAIYEFIPQNPPNSPATLAEHFARLERRRSPGNTELWLNYAVRLTADGSYIGRVEATVKSETADIAYLFDPRYWGRGYAREAVAAMIERLCTDFGVKIVRAHMDTRNVRSAALLKALGFKFVEELRDADHFKGAPSHENVYELRRWT